HVKYRLNRILFTFTNAIRTINWGYYGGLGYSRQNRPIINLTEFLRLRYSPFDRFMTRRETRPRKNRLQSLYWAGWKRLSDSKQVYRESAGPPPVNRRLRYRIAWQVFRGARDFVRWGRVKSFPNISNKL